MGKGGGDTARPAVAVKGGSSEGKTMKRAILMMLPVAAVAQDMPFILGTIQNRDNANITFTTTQNACENNDHFVYAQSSGGKVSITGCYRLVDDQLMVFWSDGDVFTYPVTALKLSPEMQRRLERSR